MIATGNTTSPPKLADRTPQQQTDRNGPGSQDDERGVYQLVRPRGMGYAVRNLSPACLTRLIDFPEIVLRSRSCKIVKSGRTATLVRTEIPVEGRMVPVAYKRVRRRSWIKVLGALIGSNGTLRSWRMGHILLNRGVQTASPLAVVVPHRHAANRESYLATRWIGGAVNLHEFIRGTGRLPAAERNRRLKSAARSLGELIGRLHAAKIGHRDLKLGNLLAVELAQRVETYVIDLDGARVRMQLSRRRKARNLSRLAFDGAVYRCLGHATRLRFLKSYLSASSDSTWSWKDAWRQIEKLTADRMARKRCLLNSSTK